MLVFLHRNVTRWRWESVTSDIFDLHLISVLEMTTSGTLNLKAVKDDKRAHEHCMELALCVELNCACMLTVELESSMTVTHLPTFFVLLRVFLVRASCATRPVVSEVTRKILRLFLVSLFVLRVQPILSSSKWPHEILRLFLVSLFGLRVQPILTSFHNLTSVRWQT
jgi:hypothetical protein